ncbi:MAG: hypothetical protein IPJ65_22140 [Archangiaceae bacterium]|nr:hypothetical protein [Archangiaceae bacterium]
MDEGLTFASPQADSRLRAPEGNPVASRVDAHAAFAPLESLAHGVEPREVDRLAAEATRASDEELGGASKRFLKGFFGDVAHPSSGATFIEKASGPEVVSMGRAVARGVLFSEGLMTFHPEDLLAHAAAPLHWSSVLFLAMSGVADLAAAVVRGSSEDGATSSGRKSRVALQTTLDMLLACSPVALMGTLGLHSLSRSVAGREREEQASPQIAAEGVAGR